MPLPQGPNVRRLIVHKMALDMVPPGAGLGGALASIARPGGIEEHAAAATEWVAAAIAAVKSASDNPFGDDDEAIAGEILLWADADQAEHLLVIAEQKAQVRAEIDRMQPPMS